MLVGGLGVVPPKGRGAGQPGACQPAGYATPMSGRGGRYTYLHMSYVCIQ